MKCELCIFWQQLHGPTGNCSKRNRVTNATDTCAEGEAEDDR